MLFCSKCLKDCTVPGAMHNRTWIHQCPSRKITFWGRNMREVLPREKDFLDHLRKGRMVHEAPHYRSCAGASAEEDESPSGFGLGGKGGASTSQISPSFCFIAAFPLSDSAVTLDSLLRGGWRQCRTCRESRAGISKSCLSAVRSVGC